MIRRGIIEKEERNERKEADNNKLDEKTRQECVRDRFRLIERRLDVVLMVSRQERLFLKRLRPRRRNDKGSATLGPAILIRGEIQRNDKTLLVVATSSNFRQIIFTYHKTSRRIEIRVKPYLSQRMIAVFSVIVYFSGRQRTLCVGFSSFQQYESTISSASIYYFVINS